MSVIKLPKSEEYVQGKYLFTAEIFSEEKKKKKNFAEEGSRENRQISSYLIDVTLVCEDGTRIPTYQLVLSVSSFFFKAPKKFFSSKSGPNG